ncbi:MAG TPA: ATP-binding protein [Gaiellaceae bacterium]
MAHPPSETAELLLSAARYLNETLEPERVYDRFHELLEDAVPHAGVVVSAFDPATELITCEYAWVDGEKLDPAIFPSLPVNREGGGMQSRVITTGEPLLVSDVPAQVKKPGGVYYDVDREGRMKKLPEEGPPGVRAAIMLPVKHEGEVVGVVQLMNADAGYDQAQLELAEGLVGLMGAAARNARLHETAQTEAAARARAEATAAEREHAARVLDAVGDGVFLLDDRGMIRFWNHAAELVTRKAGDDAWGRPAGEIFGRWDRLAERIPVSEGSAAARPVTLPVDVDGRELWLSFVAVRSPAGVVYAFRDLTLERRLDEAKSEFVATVSHELRTPMTAVLGAAKTLMRDDIELDPERRRQLLEMIGAQGTRLTKIAEDLLIASRLDRDELRLDRDPVDIGDLVHTAVEHMRESLPEAISLTASTESNGTAALGDRSRIEQVLVNLIDNAIKYSPGGGEVSVSTAASPHGVRVEVRDTGIGIPAAEQASVFEKFYRGSLDGQAVRPGTGLGLYICRELVQRMGGTIGVESDPGSGSTFFFELPRAA